VTPSTPTTNAAAPPDPYAPPAALGAIDLDLSRNEGRASRAPWPPPDPVRAARYPDLTALTAQLAGHYGVAPEHVLPTAGGDDALLRLCLAHLVGGASGRTNAVVATPTFEMIPRYVAMAGGELRTAPWPHGALPVDGLLDCVDANTRIVFVVSPNNPTGGIATEQDLVRLRRGAPNALLVLDAAYEEFTTSPLTALALRLPRTVVVRTLSKAFGLAGLRVGCALGPTAEMRRLEATGNPMPVSSASAAIACAVLAHGGRDVAAFVDRIAAERRQLVALLRGLGADVALPNEANFVLVRGLPAERVARCLAALGIAVRRFPGHADLHDALRITLPGEASAFDRVLAALEATLAPKALLFDMDGVLADVRSSYDAAIVATAREHGVLLRDDDLAAARRRGDANDDWRLTQELLAQRGVDVAIGAVVAGFQRHYASLRTNERPLVDRTTLLRWGQRRPLGIVTGRPREEAEHFLAVHGLRDCFAALVCREDAALKPDPAPVRLALGQLGCTAAWMLGDTRDDVRAARSAGVIPIGVGPNATGAAFSLTTTNHLDPLLP
jgi:histidinol-phosphate aminotransferase